MSEFQLAYELVKVKGNTKLRDWVFELSVPEEVAEVTPYEELREIQGDIKYGCPFDPMVGDEVSYLGHVWMVTKRKGKLYKPYSRQTKYVPACECLYVGRLSGE